MTSTQVTTDTINPRIVTKKLYTKGFTIVELLIVIVIIAILAAITIVAYNGITAKANTTSAVNNTENVIKKIESYNAESSAYPATSSVLTGALSTSSYYLNSTFGFDGVAISSSHLPANPSTVNLYKCGTGSTTAAPTTAANVTTQTGVRIDYWDYTNKTTGTRSAGVTSGLVGTYNIGCGISS